MTTPPVPGQPTPAANEGEVAVAVVVRSAADRGVWVVYRLEDGDLAPEPVGVVNAVAGLNQAKAFAVTHAGVDPARVRWRADPGGTRDRWVLHVTAGP